MSRRGDINIKCWDGDYYFRLRIQELMTLQEKCNAGPYQIMMRFGDQKWLVQDIIETLRLGLIGGGMKQEDARRLIEQHVERVPLADNIQNAQTVLMAAIVGVDDEQLGEDQAATANPERNPVK